MNEKLLDLHEAVEAYGELSFKEEIISKTTNMDVMTMIAVKAAFMTGFHKGIDIGKELGAKLKPKEKETDEKQT